MALPRVPVTAKTLKNTVNGSPAWINSRHSASCKVTCELLSNIALWSIAVVQFINKIIQNMESSHSFWPNVFRMFGKQASLMLVLTLSFTTKSRHMFPSRVQSRQSIVPTLLACSEDNLHHIYMYASDSNTMSTMFDQKYFRTVLTILAHAFNNVSILFLTRAADSPVVGYTYFI